MQTENWTYEDSEIYLRMDAEMESAYFMADRADASIMSRAQKEDSAQAYILPGRDVMTRLCWRDRT